MTELCEECLKKNGVKSISELKIEPKSIIHYCEKCKPLLTGFDFKDVVNKPAHYTSFLVREPGEVIDVIEAWGLPYHLGNVVKYIARANLKGKYLEDLKKARWYLDRYIKRLEGQNDVPKV